MTVAYVFWHRPRPDVDPAAYADALGAFHAALGAEPPRGLLASWALRLRTGSGCDDEGSEDGRKQDEAHGETVARDASPRIQGSASAPMTSRHHARSASFCARCSRRRAMSWSACVGPTATTGPVKA